MKKLLLVCVVFSTQLFAQKPEKIYPITTQPRETPYYTTQAELWKKETDKHPKSTDAWENYYLAMRYSNEAYNPGHADKQKLMGSIVEQMSKNVPNTIEYYRCNLSYGGWPNNDTTARVAIMKKALAIAPNDRAVLEDYVVYCETSGNIQQSNTLNATLYKSNAFAQSLMELGYNVLMSADKNAIVFTCGDNDTFPVWVLQYARGIRPDIKVINIPLCMGIPSYLKMALKQKNVVLPDDFWNKAAKVSDMTEYMKMLALEINKANPNVPVYFTSTCELENVFPDSLYCTGLAWRFSTKHIDNFAMLRNNIENHFHLDYLNGSIYDDNNISQEIVDNCNMLYVTPFALLYKHYKSMREDSDKVVFYHDYVMRYASKMGKQKEMTDYLESAN